MELPEEIVRLCAENGTYVTRVTVFELAPVQGTGMSELMDLHATAKLVGLGLSAFRDLRRDGRRSFPKPLGNARKPMWRTDEVEQWMEADRSNRT